MSLLYAMYAHVMLQMRIEGHRANSCSLSKLSQRLMCLSLEQKWDPDLQWPPSVTTANLFQLIYLSIVYIFNSSSLTELPYYDL